MGLKHPLVARFLDEVMADSYIEEVKVTSRPTAHADPAMRHLIKVEIWVYREAPPNPPPRID